MSFSSSASDTFQNSIEKISSSLDQYIVRPSESFGLSGFVFDVEGETKIQQSSNITDNYVEDNSTVQDHIAVAPLTIQLTRYVGELVDRRDTEVAKLSSAVDEKLTKFAPFAPNLTNSAYLIKNKAEELVENVKRVTNDVSNLFSLFENLNPSATKKQQAFIYFSALQEKGVLISVQTPFSYYENMAIESLIATEDEESKDIATFSMTLKQIRFASVTTTEFNASQFQGRSGSQNSPNVKNGKANGSQSALSALFGSF